MGEEARRVPAVYETGGSNEHKLGCFPEIRNAKGKTIERVVMIKGKQKIIIGALVSTLGALIVVTQIAWTDSAADPLRLDGAWMVTVPGTKMQWTYTCTHSTVGGAAATVQGSFNAGIDPTLAGLFPQAQYLGPIVGEAAITGPKTANRTMVANGIKNGPTGPEIVYTLVAFGGAVKTAAGEMQGNYHFHIFTPEQLAHEGGLPHLPQSPALCIPVQSVERRIPLFRRFPKDCGD